MDYEQKAPLGYLWASKLAVVLFGKQEMALRLFSLLGGIISLFAFIPVARYFLKPWTVILAVAILALGEPFVYHSTEAKQYGTELLASILAFYLFTKYHRSFKVSSLLLWGISGAILLWFSYSSIFVLAGIAIVVSCNSLLQKEWKQFFLRLIPFVSWLLSFALVYYFFLSRYQDSGWLKNFFEVVYGAYMPLPPSSLKDMIWLAYSHYMILERDLGILTKFGDIKDYSAMQTLFRMPFLPLSLEMVGIIYLFIRNRYHLFLLALPIGLALLASSFRLYPFYERFILFLSPLFIILIAYGAEKAAEFFSKRTGNIVASVLFLLLLFPPTWNAVRFTVFLTTLYKKEYNREAILYVNDRYQPGDAVYVYWNMNHAYKYYKEAYPLAYIARGGEDLRSLSANKQDYYTKVQQQIGDLSGKKRLWVIQNPKLKNNIGEYPGRNPRWYHKSTFSHSAALTNKVMELGGTPVDSFQRESIDVKLFELKN
ncbi:glycosyltransferase family 39 protein [Hymenobacter tibetensis]|uniref:Glycosyltransferase family 39 protein n=1 Tax=Hymenobacter tibetensis TaxID=497967 RepID=A0ABY4D2F1_9BACT|nr:glycosyltransferase family 39 protein [Hymenobacter tibetensis]UOG75311.1 glycosyltransferase family 39 protein [Hymenobacter tibetensis]